MDAQDWVLVIAICGGLVVALSTLQDVVHAPDGRGARLNRWARHATVVGAALFTLPRSLAWVIAVAFTIRAAILDEEAEEARSRRPPPKPPCEKCGHTGNEGAFR
jgi:hypothetical protein